MAKALPGMKVLSSNEGGALPQVVVVTQRIDPHADAVIGQLADAGVEVVRLNTEDCMEGLEFAHEVGPSGTGGRLRVLDSGRAVEPGRVRSVWWRRPGDYPLLASLPDAQRRFAEREIDQGLRGFLGALGCRWVSHPEAIRAAGWKGEQLARAAGMGLRVPRSLVTTSREAARRFDGTCGGEILYKVMGDPFLGRAWSEAGPLVTQTTAVTPEHLDALAEREPVPCLFQERVPKARELRVTVIGGTVLSAALNPFVGGRELLDWRGHEEDVRWEPWSLPATVEQRCRDLVASYGLAFGAIDLILTPAGEYVFLELNPNGQFLFVELLVPELPLCATLAGLLAAPLAEDHRRQVGIGS